MVTALQINHKTCHDIRGHTVNWGAKMHIIKCQSVQSKVLRYIAGGTSYCKYKYLDSHDTKPTKFIITIQ